MLSEFKFPVLYVFRSIFMFSLVYIGDIRLDIFLTTDYIMLFYYIAAVLY